MTHPDAQRAFEEMMPEPFGYVCDAYGDHGSLTLYEEAQVSSFGRVYRNDPVFTADQLRTAMQAAWDAALSQRPAAPASFEQYWTEDGRNLCKSPLGSFEARMHKRTWDAATERAAKVCEDQADFHQEMHNTQAEQAADACAVAIRGAK